MDSKFGNFNTPIIMKLCSRYNKEITEENMKADPLGISKIVVERLNKLLASEVVDEKGKWPLVTTEVASFSHLNGFINVFLINPESQFADRIQVTLKKKQTITNKGSLFSGPLAPAGGGEFEAAFVIRPIGYL